MKNNRFTTAVTACVACLLLACHNGQEESSYPILKASLEKTEVSMNDLFSKVEVLPLETYDSCLLVLPWKMLHWEDYYAIFDASILTVFVYDRGGNYVRRIGCRGQGPGEYAHICDVQRDDKTGTYFLLSPFSEMFSYASDGTFLQKYALPKKSSYFSFENYGKYWVTWGFPNSDDDACISFISKETVQCERDWWRCNENLTGYMGYNLSKYADDIYYALPFVRDVYKLTGKDSLQVVYTWDFGKDNYSMSQWGVSDTQWGGIREKRMIDQYLTEYTIPYFINAQVQTDSFYYCQFGIGMKKNYKNTHLFYRKSDGKNVYFETTSEGLHFKPMYWGEDYVISISDEGDMLDLDIYKSFLPPSEYAKIANRKEDDNPFLLKCYYK